MSEENKVESERKGAGIRECVVCGRLFYSEWSFEKFCSHECRAEVQRKRQKNRYVKGSYAAKREEKKNKKKDDNSISWDEIRAVLGELGISSYHKAIEIIEQRRKEAKEKELAEAFEKEKKEK